MGKHTPGPWQFYADLPSIQPDWYIVTDASRMRVLATMRIEPGNETDSANGRLIAAAPELLEACESALELICRAAPNAWANGNTHPDYGGTDEGEVLAANAIKRIEAIIAKATTNA